MLMVVYHLQKVPEMRLERWWNTTFRVFPAENFREQRNVWKGSPVLSVAMFQTEICVPFHYNYLSISGFLVCFSVNGTDLCKWWTRFRGQLYKSWILLTIYQTANRPVSECKCMVNNLGKGGTQDACSFYKFPQRFISFRLFTANSTAANRRFRRNLFEKWTAPE